MATRFVREFCYSNRMQFANNNELVDKFHSRNQFDTFENFPLEMFLPMSFIRAPLDNKASWSVRFPQVISNSRTF